MKLKKTIFSLLTLAAIGSVATTFITSCSGVSQDIINNMVKVGDESQFAAGTSLKDEINIALTDKDATAAFKTSVVNKILYGWFNSLKDKNSEVTTDIKQWTKDIDNDWDSQIQSSKNSHLSNWQYYFQNDVLNPVGGTKDAWVKAQWYSKIRDYFTTQITKNSYLAIPTVNDSLNGNFYTKTDDGLLLSDLNKDVEQKGFSTNLNELLGTSGNKMTTEQILSPDWWPAINFYAKANSGYDPNSSSDQDKSYALIQQLAFEDWTKNVRPISTGYVLWNYSLGKDKEDLKSIYNANKVTDADSLKTPSFNFPYFGIGDAGGDKGPNQKFADFVKQYKTQNRFLVNQASANAGDAGELNLINIPNSGYSDSTDATLSLIDMSSSAGGDSTPYETYYAPLLDMYTNSGNYSSDTMPSSAGTSDNTDFQDESKIINNFLFAKSGAEPTSDIKVVPDRYKDNAGVNDLSQIYAYDDDSSETPTFNHSELFNHESDWYKDGAQYFVSAVRITYSSNDSIAATPYIMIRTAKGVTVEGLDGLAYLKQENADMPSDVTETTNWRPGEPFSQERENQLIKFRTAYQNFANTPLYKGVNAIDSTGGTPSGPLIDYLKSNLDTIILDTVDRVMATSSVEADSNGTSKSSYYDDNLLGLKSFVPKEGNDTWNLQLNELIQSFNLLNQYSTIITNYETNTKKLFSYSNTFSTNALYGKDLEKDAGVTVSVYKNGLASPLPLTIETGASDDNALLAKTHYIVLNNTMEGKDLGEGERGTSLIESDGLKSYFDSEGHSDLLFGNQSFNQIISADNSAGKSGGILERYNAWTNTLSAKPTDNNGKGNAKAYVYNYSENILTYNDYVNSLLWKFGSTNSFSNSVKTQAISQYLDGWTPTTNMTDAITSMYFTSKLISTDTPVSSYLNADSDDNVASLSFETYRKGLLDEWNNTLSNELGSTTISDANSNVISHGYSDKAIDYLTYQATIKRLTSADGTVSNNSKFIDWINEKIGTDFQNTAYVVWAAKDDASLNTNFKSITNGTEEDIDAIYGWKTNFDGQFDNIYKNTNITAEGTKTYASYDSYWQFAPMPITNENDASMEMGFLGLQTKNSNTLDKISTNAKDALFGQNVFSSFKNNDAPCTGTLYQFHNGNAEQSRSNLVVSIKKDVGETNPSVTKINQYVSFINNQTGTFSNTSSQIANTTDVKQKLSILIQAVQDKSIIPDKSFDGYNVVNPVNPTWELKAQDDSNFISDDNSKGTVGSRIRVMQLNLYDVDKTIWTGKDGTPSVPDHLKSILGSDMLDYLVAQAALDSSQQTVTITDVIKTVFSGNKLAVYDRRFNDQLGSQWVANWKTKN